MHFCCFATLPVSQTTICVRPVNGKVVIKQTLTALALLMALGMVVMPLVQSWLTETGIMLWLSHLVFLAPEDFRVAIGIIVFIAQGKISKDMKKYDAWA